MTVLPGKGVAVFEAAEVGQFVSKSAHKAAIRELRPALLAAQHRLAATDARSRAAKARRRKPPVLPQPQPINLLNQLDLNVTTPKSIYTKRLDELQGKIAKRTRKLSASPRSLILVFEGPDAAGKGGAIRRVTQAMDARLWQVHGIAAPTDEEAARPYLWRFWRRLPARGHVAIFDRSWYGRVLVERVEGFADPGDWKRAYNEINEFEEELSEFGYVIRKFWLHISADEQLRRFQDRKRTPYKQYKLTEEDWRNRDKWQAYEASACEMIERTSTAQAPWIVVPANDKYTARLRVLETVNDALKQATRQQRQAT